MSDADPPIHILTEDGKLRVCLSYAAKWFAGILATLVGAGLIAAFTFAWQSNQMLGRILERVENVNQRLDRYYHRLERVEEKLDKKVDKP